MPLAILRRCIAALTLVYALAACAPAAPQTITPTSPPAPASLPPPTRTTAATPQSALSTPSIELAAEPSPWLAQSLTFAPATSARLSFNDWEQVKADAGKERVSGRSSLRQRLDFLMARGNGWELMSLCGALRLETPQAHWGWDITDAQWEATIQLTSRASVCVVAFPPTFDLGPTQALYRSRGFHESA